MKFSEIDAFSVDGHRHVMWDLLLVLCSVFTFILLYWFHAPSSQPTVKRKSTDKDETDDRASSTRDQLESMRRDGRQRLNLIRRRKELMERDIILNLGLKLDERGFESFCDKFNSFEVVSAALVKAGFAACDIIIGIDMTASNEWQGKRTFNKTSLHKTMGSKVYNPYQKVINIIGKTLSFICCNHVIHAYGFGDAITQDHSVFPLRDDESLCHDFSQVIEAYTTAVKKIRLGGPTNLAPIIRKAVTLCQYTGRYHILIIIVDGRVSSKCEEDTVKAIVQASEHPLSIIAIGIGDGPFSSMFEYDDGLPQRKFDNFQFVNFHRTVTKSKHEAAFALHALMEIPDQYKAINQLGYLKDGYMSSSSTTSKLSKSSPNFD